MPDVTATAVSPDDLVCEARRNGAENVQPPRFFERIHLRPRMAEALDDRSRHLVDRLLGTES
jgi:hypothetical protein